MSDYEKALVASNDARAGRVVPGWKYWSVWVVTIVALIVMRSWGDVPLVAPIVAGAWSLVFMSLLSGYKARSIR